MSNYENRIQKDLLTDAVFTESAEEFILPDYMPEVGRVFRVSATLLPEEEYLGTDGAEFSGVIEYRLLYSDGEGNVTEAPLEGHYRYRIPVSDKENAFAYTEEQIESVSVRPSAPRKLGIRTRICAHPHIIGEMTVGSAPEALIPQEACEVLVKEQRVARRYTIRSGTLRCEGRFVLEGVETEGLRLLSVSADVLPEAAEAREGYLSTRGRILATLLLQKEGDVPFLKSYTLPFEEELTGGASCMGDAVTIRGFCPTPTVSFEEDGQDTVILLDAEYSLHAVLHRNETLPFLCDIYAPGASYTVKSKPYYSEFLLGTYTGNMTSSSDLPLPADFNTDGKALLPLFTIKEVTGSTASDRLFIEGKCHTLLLGLNASGEGERTELSFPFRMELPLGTSVHEDDTFSFSVTPVGGSAYASGGTVRLSTELAVSACAHRPFSMSLPTEAIKNETKEGVCSGCLRVYYPTDEDSLWSVGKMYGIPINKLKKQNGIPEDGDTAEQLSEPLDGYAYLLVGDL